MAAGEQSVDDLEHLAGRVLDGRYHLETYVDRGAFGFVYRAMDRKLNSPVAVKIGRTYREFMKEAKLAAGVRHPNIVQVTDYGLDGGLAYMVMEFLEGDDVDKLLQRSDNSFSAAMVEQLVCEVGDGLVHAHSVKLIHRDLKPGNIIFRRSGNPSDTANALGRFVLVDFGIAAQLDAEGTQRNETWNGAGTAEYIAPEMLRRNPVATPQCDIYGFGTILYLLLTGRVPFPQLENSRLGLANCLKAVAHDPPPPFASVAQGLNYPPALEELILQCLEKDPARRPSSISEVCERFLANYSSESESGNFSHTLRPGGLMDTSRRRLRKSWRRTSSTPPVRKRSPIPLIAAVMCVAAMAAFWIRSAGQTRHEDQAPKSDTTPPMPIAAIQLRSTFTMIAGEKEQAFDVTSPLQIPAGGMVELKFRVENVPPDHALEFSTPTATSAVKIETRPGGDGASQVYSLVVPDRATPAGPLPPLTFAARVAGVATPVEAALSVEVLPPAPRLVLEGTLEPPDALLTVDGAPVEIREGRWTWNEPEKEQVTLRAVREGFGDWEQTLSDRNSSPVSVILERLPAMRLEGTLEPADATLTVNGAAIEVRDGTWRWSSAQQTQVTVNASRKGFEDWETTLSTAGAFHVPIALERLPAIRLEGTLDPADALLTVNGDPVPIQDGHWTWTSQEPVRAVLKATREGFADWEQVFTDAGQTSVPIQMESSIQVFPVDAAVLVDGKPVSTQDGKLALRIPPDSEVVVSLTRDQQSKEFRLTRSVLASLEYALRLPAPPSLPPVDPMPAAGLKESAAALMSQSNEFCVSLYKTYIGMDEFEDAYSEAYRVLRLSKDLDKLTSAGISGERVNQLLAEMEAELRHVERRLAEFARVQRPANKTGQRLVAGQLEQVQKTFDTILDQAGLPSRSSNAEETAPPPIEDISSQTAAVTNPAELIASLASLRKEMKAFCAAMFKTYRGMKEFEEAYQEAYELLELSGQLKLPDQFDSLADPEADALRESLQNFAGELQHVETHITEFAEAQQPPDEAGQEAVFARLDDVESMLHSAMHQLGMERKHAESETSTTEPSPEHRVPAAQLARNLVVKANSFSRALQHNFKKNAEFPEAYEEALEFYNGSAKLADLLKWGLITKECRELFTSLDGKVHHLEIHVSGFVADDSGSKEGASRVVRKLLEVEDALHALGEGVGVEIHHPE